MRRFVAALLVAALAATLTACGGGGGEEAAEPASGSAPPPPPPTAEAVESAPDRTPLESVAFEPFPTDGETTVTPASVLERLETDQPMLLFFFDRRQNTADDQRAEIDAVLKEYRGTIDLLTFDVGQDLSDGKHDEADEQAVTLARTLGVEFTPYVVIVDGQGLVTWRHRGFVERGIMEREVIRATD